MPASPAPPASRVPSPQTSPRARTSPSPLERGKAAVGRAVLEFCPEGRRVCSKTKCWLQPFCACARREFEVVRRSEGRIWLVIGVCGGLTLLVGFLWALLGG